MQTLQLEDTEPWSLDGSDTWDPNLPGAKLESWRCHQDTHVWVGNFLNGQMP